MAGESDILKQIMGLLGGTGGAAAVSQMNPVTGIASAVPALFQTGLGIAQEIKADKLANSTTRPIMRTPGSQLEALANARNMATGQAPGISAAMQQLAQSQAGSIAGIQNSGGGNAETLAALTMLDQNAGNQARNIGAMQENWRAGQMGNLQNQLMQMADTENNLFRYNEDEPYKNIMAASQALHNAAPQNVQGGLNGLGGSLASMVGPMKGNTGAIPPGTGTDSRYQSPSRIQAETPIDAANANSLANMGPQGEGPQNGMEARQNYPYSPSPTPILTPGADENIQVHGQSLLSPPPIGNGEIPYMGSTIPTDNQLNIQSKQPDLTPILGRNATPTMLGGAFGNIVKMMNDLRGGDPSVDQRIRKGESDLYKYNSSRKY
jgi:hypothetical protein